jgi:hypothetical protein
VADGRRLIRGGSVVSMGPEVGDLSRDDVLIEGSKVSNVLPAW